MKIKRSEFKNVYKELNSINHIVYILEEYCKKEALIYEVNVIKSLVECLHCKTGKLVSKLINNYSKYI